MNDRTPYIIVDNQRIAPLDRTVRPHRTDDQRGKKQAPPFGVVDRVTISSEARQRYRLYMESVAQSKEVQPPESLPAPKLKK